MTGKKAKRRHPLAREIVAVLIAKATAITLIYFAFFSPPHRVHATAVRTAQMLLGAAPTARAATGHSIGKD